MFSFYQLSLPELKISFTSIYKGLVSSKNTKCKDILNLLNYHRGAFLVAQQVKNLPAVQETPGLIPGWEDPLEKEMATHSSILAWKIL